MSAVAVNNLVINTYADFSEIFTLDDANSNSPLDLTDYTVLSQMRKHPGSSTAVSFGTTVIDASEGRLQVGLTTAQTASLKPGRYVYDVLLIDPSGVTSRVVEGMVLVREGVTRL
jgi:hypothetical protein